MMCARIAIVRALRRLTAVFAAGLVSLTAGAGAAGLPYALHGDGDGALAAGAAFTLAVTKALDARMPALTPADLGRLQASAVPRVDRSATRRWSPAADAWSDVLMWGALCAPLALTASASGRKDPETLLALHAETVVWTIALTQITKSLVQRTRPFAYNPATEIPAGEWLRKSARRSFPSGHAANAFAGAVALAGIYARLHPGDSARAWVWGGSLTVASTVGLLRYLSGRHFPTDIVAGAALGAAVGYAVPRLHETSDDMTGGGVPVPVCVGFTLRW
jgi:membrane-associated phospholipid phosphatase